MGLLSEALAETKTTTPKEGGAKKGGKGKKEDQK
jgi:hypothetical protein